MSRFKEYSDKETVEVRKHEDHKVVNFMEGTSYTVNSLLTLKMIAASSIFGEPSYYRSNHVGKNSGLNKAGIPLVVSNKKTTNDVFTKAIDASLDYNFKETLKLAVELRNDYGMRLNPAVIAIRAVMHKDRIKFNEENPNFMRDIFRKIINIPTDIQNQFEYWMYENKSKAKLPTIVKKAWAEAIEKASKYQIAKYKSDIIDLARISHARGDNNATLQELLKSGTVEVEDDESTWERLRSMGDTWEVILQKTYIPHMALLRNLRGIFEESNSDALCNQVCTLLKEGVEKGKQFPFRYYTALQALMQSNVNFKSTLKACLEECMDKSIANFPKLKGKTICLSDNSGSAWGSCNSEYGSVTIAEIANLSSVMTAINSDEGEVGTFGDRLIVTTVDKRNGILSQHSNITEAKDKLGQSTENGLWLFFEDAIGNKKHYDNIFIYSDQQAGRGGLYGVDASLYAKYAYKGDGRFIDLLKLVAEYRKVVNKNVNIFSIQVAGYNNSVLPDNSHRTSILSGWTGKEAVYAKRMIELWGEVEQKQNNNVQIKTSV